MPDNQTSPRSNSLPVALIVPDTTRRRSLVTAIGESQLALAREFHAYPSSRDLVENVSWGCAVVIVDLDADVDRAICVIEDICRKNVAMTVMAYSSANDPALMRRSMHAGAREFLVEPLLPGALDDAVARTSARQRSHQKSPGKMLVFVPSKGGVGLTTITTNFALALTKESGARVVVVDLDFQLGEIALGLGLTSTFSVVDAMLNVARLDREFLSTILLKHSTGLEVLSSPEDYKFFHAPVDQGVGKLFGILRDEFDYVVVDTGTCHGNILESLFGMADKLYLVSEMTFPSLRNGHRLVAFLSARSWNRNLEVVLNRYNSRHADLDESIATKALARPIDWRIPNIYAAARAAEDSGVPLAMGDSSISRVVTQMAKAACGKPLTTEKKKTHWLFDFFRSRTVREPSRI